MIAGRSYSSDYCYVGPTDVTTADSCWDTCQCPRCGYSGTDSRRSNNSHVISAAREKETLESLMEKAKKHIDYPGRYVHPKLEYPFEAVPDFKLQQRPPYLFRRMKFSRSGHLPFRVRKRLKDT